MDGLEAADPVTGKRGPWSLSYVHRALTDGDRDEITRRAGSRHETFMADMNRQHQAEMMGLFADLTATWFDVIGMGESGGGLLDDLAKAGDDAMSAYRASRLVRGTGSTGTQTASKAVLEEFDGFVRVADEAGNSAGRGWLNGGELNLVIDVRNSALTGRKTFDEIFEFINKNYDEITSVRGTWRQGALDSNLSSYAANRASGMSKSAAALETFTGKMASGRGFGKASVVEKIGSNGNIRSVDVIFR